MLSAVNANLGERENALTRSLSLLEQEREIVRRQLGLVAELLTLERQRVAAQTGDAPEADAQVNGERAPVTESAPEPEPPTAPESQVEDEPKPPTMHEDEPDPAPAPAAESDPEARAAEQEAQGGQPEAVPDVEANPDLATVPGGAPAGDPEPTDGHNGDLLWRIEQLRRLRANLVVAAPAGPDDPGNPR